MIAKKYFYVGRYHTFEQARTTDTQTDICLSTYIHGYSNLGKCPKGSHLYVDFALLNTMHPDVLIEFVAVLTAFKNSGSTYEVYGQNRSEIKKSRAILKIAGATCVRETDNMAGIPAYDISNIDHTDVTRKVCGNVMLTGAMLVQPIQLFTLVDHIRTMRVDSLEKLYLYMNMRSIQLMIEAAQKL